MKKIEQFFAVCEWCGDKECPHFDKSKWLGITVSEGVCPMCGEYKTLIPVADYHVGYWD